MAIRTFFQTTIDKALDALPLNVTEDYDKKCASPEDDSYICHCFRKYYTEKWIENHPNGATEVQFPAWLPPDPSVKPKPKPTVTPALAHSPTTSISSAPGSLRQNKSGLGDLWAEGNCSNTSIQSDTVPRRPGFRALDSQRATNSTDTVPTRNRYQHSQEPAPAARPLPSQRVGSYQRREATPPSSSNGQPLGSTDRLKAKYSGSRGTSSSGSGEGNPYATDEGGGGRYDGNGGDNPYANDTRRAYATNGATNPYVQAAGRPYTGASSPWVSGEDAPPISGGGLDIRRKGLPLANGRVGLPNGPRLR